MDPPGEGSIALLFKLLLLDRQIIILVGKQNELPGWCSICYFV